MKTLITVLARSGSKGLPNKHLLPFNGKPLIEWTIRNAKDFAKKIGADVLVATDSFEVSNLADNLDVEAIFRNPEYATDEAGKVDAIRDLYVQLDEEYDCIIDLDATNPCRTVRNIEDAFQIFKDKSPQTLYSVVEARKNPFFNQITKNKQIAAHTACFLSNRQAAPEIYDLNANIYIYDAKWLADESNKAAITDNSEIYLMPDWSFADIDNEVDFQVAEFLHKKYILKKVGNVQSEKQDCSGSRWHGPDRVCGHGCATQARGSYFND